jgi:surface protein
MNSLETIIWMDTWKNMSHVEKMNKMFFDCSSLTTLDLSAFDTRNVLYFWEMFSNMVNLKTIYVWDNFVFTGNQWLSHQYMFSGTISLVWWNGTEYDSEKINKTYAKIDNENQIWYFTDPSHFAIRFKTQAGDEIATQWIATWETAQALTWRYMNYNYYTGADLEHEYDLTTSLYAYTEIYASWTDAYEVKFYNWDEVIYTGYVTWDNNSKLSIFPEDLVWWVWYEFLWWYEKNGNEYVNEPFNFTWTEITGDIDLYAKWKTFSTLIDW